MRDAPTEDPLALLEWVQAVSAIALFQERHGRGSKAHREAVRKTCSTLAKVLPGLIVAVARGEDLDGVDLDGPPPATDPLKRCLYAALTLVNALAEVIGGQWGRDDHYERLGRLRRQARTCVVVLSPEVELESRERLRRRAVRISKRGDPPPLERLEEDGRVPLRM